MSALEQLAAAVDRECPEEPVEELKRMVTDLTREIHEDRGAVAAKLDTILAEQRALSERVTRLEVSEKACSDGNEKSHRVI